MRHSVKTRYIASVLVLVVLVALAGCLDTSRPLDVNVKIERAGEELDVLASAGRFGSIIVQKITIQDGGVDMLGNTIDLDDDNDTSITADTDDQIDIEISGADDFQFTANDFTALSGSVISTNTINETTAASGVTIDSFVIQDGGFTVGAAGTIDINGVADAVILDTDGDTTISAPTDDQIDVELGGADTAVFQMFPAAATGNQTANLFEVIDTTTVFTDGTNTEAGVVVDLAIGNATAGTNQVRGVQVDAITGDAQVVEKAVFVGDGWDYAMDTGDRPIVTTAQTAFADFLGDTVPPEWDYDSGSGASDPALNAAQYGTLRATTPGTDTNFATDHAGVDMGGVFWSVDQGSFVFEARVKIDNITNVEWCVGMTDTETMEMPASIAGGDAVTTALSNGLVFCFDTGADTDEWFALGVAGDTDATGNAATGTAPVAGTYQVLRIEAESGGADARFYIDGALEVTLTANAVAAATLLTPVVVVDNLAAEAKNVDIDYIFVTAARN